MDTYCGWLRVVSARESVRYLQATMISRSYCAAWDALVRLWAVITRVNTSSNGAILPRFTLRSNGSYGVEGGFLNWSEYCRVSLM